MLPGISSRIEIELRELLFQYEKLKFRQKRFCIEIMYKHYRNSAFVGAVVASSAYNKYYADHYWISKKDWEEVGPNIINKKNILNLY